MRAWRQSIAALAVVGALVASSPVEALQCVPFAREVSGISIRGDAWTWWGAAVGQYERGQTPRIGAVVVFKKFAAMRHGHVAVIARVVNNRQVLVDHANWAPHRGKGRGKVSKMVAVADVSEANDWSEVRVWNASTRDFGTRTYPTYGFIYPVSSRGYIQQASDNTSGGDGLPLRRLAASVDPVQATADQQIAAALAEDLVASDDAVVIESKPAEAKAEPEKPAAAKEEKGAEVKSVPAKAMEARTVEAKAADAKPVDARTSEPATEGAKVDRLADHQPTSAVMAMAPARPGAASDTVWDGDVAAAQMAGSGRY